MKVEKPKSGQPTPDHAVKVFNGIRAEIYQWEQELFDGNKTTFEKIKLKGDTAVVIPFTEDGKVIIIEQEQPGKGRYVSFPGGTVDEGEDPLETSKRELFEETGYDAGDMKLWHATTPVNKVDWTRYFFVAKNCKKVGVQNLDEGGEKIEVKIVELEEIVEMLLEQKIKGSEIIMKFLKEDLIVIDKEKTFEKIKNYFL